MKQSIYIWEVLTCTGGLVLVISMFVGVTFLIVPSSTSALVGVTSRVVVSIFVMASASSPASVGLAVGVSTFFLWVVSLLVYIVLTLFIFFHNKFVFSLFRFWFSNKLGDNE